MSDENRGFLKDEYLKLQDQYEDFDRRSLTIKGWVSAGAAVAFASGFKASEPFGAATWLAIAALALSFWYLEARWKQFQYALAGRIQTLEAYFRGETPEPPPLQMYKFWFDSYGKSTNRSDLWAAARQDFVMLPYVLIVGICCLGAVADALSRP